MTAPSVSDEHKRELEAALAAALLLIYRREAAHWLSRLGQPDTEPSATSLAAVSAFAADRAEKAQSGVNQRIQSALDALPDDATPEDEAQAIAQARQEMAGYNLDTLAPWIAGAALTYAMVGTYRDTTDENGQSLADSEPFMWERHTDWEPDSCQAAVDASPAPLNDLIEIAGGYPGEVHDLCACTASPAETASFYSPDQPRDEHGRWGSGGGGESGGAASAPVGARVTVGNETGVVEAPADVYYHGSGTQGGQILSTGNETWDSKFFITPDEKVAQHYADRWGDGTVRTVTLDPTAKVFRPDIAKIDYTPERLAAVVTAAQEHGFAAVHFGGGIGTAVLDHGAITSGGWLSTLPRA